ncbi:MAG: nucleoside monophosphate kinase [Anaerolineae bacterium]|nr:nucleoside monophosphate kinase [Anaerolineae bacterium]
MSLFVLLMGVQGAGKGEQARFITQKYGIPQLSTGDLFRAMKTRQDEFARKIQQLMAEGHLIDDATTCEVVRERLAMPDARNGVIFDGFPRTPAQAEWLDNYLSNHDAGLKAVILLKLDLYTAFKRAFGRVSAKDGKTYNLYSNNEGVEFVFEPHPEGQYPPRLKAVVKVTGDELIRRPDDAHAHAIIKRIDTYVAETEPLIEYYEREGLLRRIEASKSIAAVSSEIESILDS